MTTIVFETDPCLWAGDPLSITARVEGTHNSSGEAGSITCPIAKPKSLSVTRWGRQGTETLHQEWFEGTHEEAEAQLLDLIREHRPELFAEAEAA